MNAGLLARLARLALLDGSRKAEHKRRQLQAAINVTPLVDVVLVLLIIFMVVTPMLKHAIELPQVHQPAPVHERLNDLIVTMDKEGKVTLDGAPLDVEHLGGAFSQKLDRPIYLHVDRATKLGHVRRVLSVLREAGAADVGLAVTPERQRGGS